MHYYQHHIGDFIKDTANLSDHQLATYMRMIWAYYADESPLVDDCGSIAFAVRSDEETVGRLLKHYFTLEADGWHHSRCDREIEVYRGKAEKARQSANARWKNANALPSQNGRNANESVLDANQEPRTKNQEREESPLSPKGEKTKRNTRIPDQFMLTAEMRKWASEKGISIDLRAETEKFVDYWRGAGKTKADWVATWRTWIRNAQENSGRGGRNSYTPVNKQEAIEANNQRVVEEMFRREQQRIGASPQDEFNLGDSVIIEGEVINAH